MAEQKKVWEKVGQISDMTRQDDIEYWQLQGTKAIFEAAWELVEDYYSYHKLDKNELRLDRSVENIGKISG